MSGRTTASDSFAGGCTRRRWAVASLAAGLGLWRCRGGLGADVPEKEVAEVEAQARKAGLGPFRSSMTEHYLGIGDGPEDYRNEAIKRCGGLAAAYQSHFHDKGFAVELPNRRLAVVALKDKASYAAFLGQQPGADVGGHYDLETNWLVIFDFRGGGAVPAAAKLEEINSFTLSHETAHQLTFNTGLLDRRGDVPLAVSEGLAMYAELWKPNVRSALGMINRLRLGVLINPANQGHDWIALDKLLTDDDLFRNQATEQLACAVAWVLVHYSLKTTAAVPKFRAYLDTIRPRRDPAQRLADATAKLGDLGRLNLALRKHAQRLIK